MSAVSVRLLPVGGPGSSPWIRIALGAYCDPLGDDCMNALSWMEIVPLTVPLLRKIASPTSGYECVFPLPSAMSLNSEFVIRTVFRMSLPQIPVADIFENAQL